MGRWFFIKIKTPLFDIKIDILFIATIILAMFSVKVRDFFSLYIIYYLFIVFHESSHILVGTLLGKNIRAFNISICGVSISFENDHYQTDDKIKDKMFFLKEIIIYLAGPISNFILAIVFKNVKIIFDINIALGVLNLIPIYPLDGNNVLKDLLLMCIDNNKVERVLKVLNLVIFSILLLLSIIVLINTFNPCLTLFLIYIIIINNIKDINKCYI